MTDMFAPGATLRAAREKRNLSQADIAEATRIKVHVIDAIENNDFQKLTAPLYVKGFIKMYAERVGLDPEPLVREYLVRFAQQVRPTLNADSPYAPAGHGVPQEPVVRSRVRRPVEPERIAGGAGAMLDSGRAVALRMVGDLAGATRAALMAVRIAWTQRAALGGWDRRRDFGTARSYGRSADFPVGRYAAIGTAVAVLAVIVGFVIHILRPSEAPPVIPVQVSAPVVSKAAPVASQRLRLAEEPPAPYLKPRKP